MAITVTFNPAAATPLQPATVVDIDVTTPDGLGIVFIYIKLDEDTRQQVVYDGSAFLGSFATSSITPIVNGFRYSVRFDGGWPVERALLSVRATDLLGNVLF